MLVADDDKTSLPLVIIGGRAAAGSESGEGVRGEGVRDEGVMV